VWYLYSGGQVCGHAAHSASRDSKVSELAMDVEEIKLMYLMYS
jgi:hypothetical protein